MGVISFAQTLLQGQGPSELGDRQRLLREARESFAKAIAELGDDVLQNFLNSLDEILRPRETVREDQLRSAVDLLARNFFALKSWQQENLAGDYSEPAYRLRQASSWLCRAFKPNVIEESTSDLMSTYAIFDTTTDALIDRLSVFNDQQVYTIQLRSLKARVDKLFKSASELDLSSDDLLRLRNWGALLNGVPGQPGPRKC